MPDASKPIEVFLSYAPEDERLCNELEKHLVLLRRNGLITTWHRRRASPGTDWRRAVDKHLLQASVILLLISVEFLNCDYCYGTEMEQALQLHQTKQARVVPILLKPFDWKGAKFEHLQPLPTDGRPITTWENPEEAFAHVADGIRQVIENFARSGISHSIINRTVLKSPTEHIMLGSTDVTIGRAVDNTYVINDSQVSKHHAVIRPHGQGYAIFDLKSTNRTFVNGQPLLPEIARMLRQGDSIRVGKTTFEYSNNTLVISVPTTPEPKTPLTAIAMEGTDPGQSHLNLGTGPTRQFVKPSFIDARHKVLENLDAIAPGIDQGPKNLPQQEPPRIGTGRLPPERTLNQRYRLLRAVGQGGMGAVYVAQDTQLGDRLVAVKEMSTSRLTRQDLSQAVEQFQREAHLLASLDHPNLPSIYDHFRESNRSYLVMKFIEGQTLQATLNDVPGNKLPVDEVVRIGIELCGVLEYLHTHQPQVIFRDLKPSNIMRTPKGHIFLIDFGIARYFKQEQSKDTAYFYSAGYAPPEQYGQSQTNPRSDIYALGATLHQMLSGHNPASKPLPFPDLQLIDQTIPVQLAKLIAQMLELNEQARPASAAEVKMQLESVLIPQQITSQPSLPDKVIPPSKVEISPSSTDQGYLLYNQQHYNGVQAAYKPAMRLDPDNVPIPSQPHITSGGGTYVITQPCIGVKDASCVDVCPVDCIHPSPNEPGFDAAHMLYINPDECISCGACEPACPVTAIFEESAVPNTWRKYITRNADFFREPPLSLSVTNNADFFRNLSLSSSATDNADFFGNLSLSSSATDKASISIYRRLKKIIVDQLGVDESEVVPSASFVEDLNADSLDLVELIMSLEEEFKVQISDEDAEKITTVQEAEDYIEEHLR